MFKTIAITKNPNFPLVFPSLKKECLVNFTDIKYHPVHYYDFEVGWMFPPKSGKYCLGETGFFFCSAHFDRKGIFDKSSLRGQAFLDSLANFKSDGRFIDKILSGKYHASKFYQPKEQVKWDGVVFATQVPKDRSITTVATQEAWWMKYEEACSKYKNKLFVKIHPWVKDEVEQGMVRIAKLYGCSYGKVGNDILKYCRFVVTFNSTYMVDCMLHGAKVACIAPGYFSDCGYPHFTNGTWPDDVPAPKIDGKKLVEWLAHKYCINTKMPTEELVKLFRWMADRDSFLEVPEEFSYYANMHLLTL